MSHSIIASQLDAQANQYLRDDLPDHQVTDIDHAAVTDDFIVRIVLSRPNAGLL